MKTKCPTRKQRDLAARRAWYRHCIVVGAMLVSCGTVARADSTSSTNSPAVKPLTPGQLYEGGKDSYDNWVDLSVGGLFVNQSTAQAQQQYQLSNDPFGGISDLHLQQNIDKKTTLTLDGHALFDQNDYKMNFRLQREDFGYIQANVTDFRTWYNGAGGYFPPTGVQYQLPGDDLYLDRGAFSVEAGLTPKDLPQVVFKYEHSYRDGDKSSTIWGPVHPDQTTAVRGLYPSFYDINEKVDTYTLDVTHQIKNTDFGAGVLYQTAKLNDNLQETYWSGEPVQRDVTNQQGTSYDMFNAHAFSETWFKNGIFFSTGYMFANVDDNFSGSRNYGDDFNVIYTPNPLNGLGYASLNGSGHEQEQVANLNLMATPVKYMTVVPSLRVQSDTWNANSAGIGTQGIATSPYAGTSDGESLDVMECLDVRYTGVTNWVYYAGAQLTEGDGNLNQYGGLAQVNGIGPQPVLELSDETRWFQKYFLGARWYPARRTSIDFGGYFKNNQYNYNFPVDSTYNGAASGNRYPDYLVMQSFQTYDGSVRLNYRPFNNVILVSRYEYQHSIINTTPDSISGLGESQSSTMNSQIIAQNVTWTPLARLCLQAGFNYVLSRTDTPTDAYTQSVLNSENNYWTLTFNSMVVLDDKTDLNLDFLYYHAGDFNNNAAYGVPLGTGAEQYTATAGITRRITDHLRVNLKYAYTQYNDWASGGNNNYYAQMVYSTLQYRF
jgi:hypothetical protein